MIIVLFYTHIFIIETEKTRENIVKSIKLSVLELMVAISSILFYIHLVSHIPCIFPWLNHPEYKNLTSL